MNLNKQVPLNARDLYGQKYKTSRYNLLLVVICSAVNIIMAAVGSLTYFVFSATLPYSLVLDASYFTGRLPEEQYLDWPEAEPFLDISYLYIMIGAAAIIVLAYLACFFFSGKGRVGWMITALVFFSIDTLYMIFVYGIDISMILDIVLHAAVLYYLITGVTYGLKLKKLPPEEEPIAVPVTENGEEIAIPSEEQKSEPEDSAENK